MPGFNIGGGGDVNNTVETRRKHRWIFSTVGQDATVGRDILLLLKTAQRPKFNLEKPELHHDQEVAYFAGKQTWDELSMEFYDAEQQPNSSEAIWNWIAGTVVAQVPAATVGQIGARDCRQITTPGSHCRNSSRLLRFEFEYFSCHPLSQPELSGWLFFRASLINYFQLASRCCKY